MAEIRVEPKRGGLGWLWAIVVLALLGAAAWYFMNNSRAVPATSPAERVLFWLTFDGRWLDTG